MFRDTALLAPVNSGSTTLLAVFLGDDEKVDNQTKQPSREKGGPAGEAKPRGGVYILLPQQAWRFVSSLCLAWCFLAVVLVFSIRCLSSSNIITQKYMQKHNNIRHTKTYGTYKRHTKKMPPPTCPTTRQKQLQTRGPCSCRKTVPPTTTYASTISIA